MPRNVRTEREPITREPVTVHHLIRPRERMWRAMRMLKSFDLPTLCMTADVPHHTARQFVGMLVRCRYLGATTNGSGSTSWKVRGQWGPRPIEIRRVADYDGFVYRVRDPNSGFAVDYPVRHHGDHVRNRRVNAAESRSRKLDAGGEG